MRNHSNLVPSRVHNQAMIIYISRGWFIACSIILVLTTTACIVWRSDATDIQNEITSLSSVGASAEAQLEEASALRQRKTKLLNELCQFTRLSNTRIPPTVFSLFCSRTAELSGRIRLTDFSMREIPVIGTDGKGIEGQGIEGFQVEVSGCATDDAAIEQFVDGLEQCELFRQVELRSTQGVTNHQGDSRQFQVFCHLIVDVVERYEPSGGEVALSHQGNARVRSPGSTSGAHRHE